MSTPAQIIARLDSALVRRGMTATLRRPPATDVTVKASLRPRGANDLTGDIRQGDMVAVLSPTEASAASWPLPVRANDKLLVGGKTYNVVHPKPISVGGTLVRIELMVRG